MALALHALEVCLQPTWQSTQHWETVVVNTQLHLDIRVVLAESKLASRNSVTILDSS